MYLDIWYEQILHVALHRKVKYMCVLGIEEEEITSLIFIFKRDEKSYIASKPDRSGRRQL